MQDRVVVLVHHPQLVGAQPVGLAQEPAPDHPHPDQGDGQCGTAHSGDRRQLRAPVVGQGLLRDARRDQPDDAAVPSRHRRHRADRRAQRAGEDLGERLAAQRRLDGAEVLLADQRRVGMGVSRAVGRHDRDERDVGVRADRLGDRLQSRGRPAGLDRRGGRGGIGQRGRDGDHLLARGVVAVAAGVERASALPASTTTTITRICRAIA